MKASDVVIIGGGVIGLCCTRWLTEAGLKVAVLEWVKVGQEASWAAAGMLAPHFETLKNLEFFLLCQKSRESYQELWRKLYEEKDIDIDRLSNPRHPALFFESSEIELSQERHKWQIDMANYLIS